MVNIAFSGTGAARRTLFALGIACAFALSLVGPSAPAGLAAAPPAPEPSARLEAVVKSVRIHDDREGPLSGTGEMAIYAGIWRCNVGSLPPCYDGARNFADLMVKDMPETVPNAIVRATRLFEASSGDVVTLDLPVPGAGDLTWAPDTSPEHGFAISAGQTYMLQIEMEELDPANGEYMGRVARAIDTGEHGLGLGTHTARSVRGDGVTPGDYTVTYEIRRVPLPDLKPVGIKVSSLPGSAKQRVCMAVQNVEVVHAGSFEVELKANNQPVPNGRYTVGLLAPGTHADACVDVVLPTASRLKLSATVDEARRVTELNEANNLYETLYEATSTEPATAPTAEPTPTASSSKDQPDLVVSAIKVNGRVPDGKDDCKDGKNDIAVIVGNAGAAKAGDVVVRLVVNGNVKDRSVSGLDVGKELEVRFEDVRLGKGRHTLAATADATATVAEARDDNNERTVTATCKDDN